MPITYHCDQCDKTAETMVGWYIVRLALLYEDPNAPVPPGGTTLEEQRPDYIFDSKGCRTQWLAAHELT